jgi:hypothetical protein
MKQTLKQWARTLRSFIIDRKHIHVYVLLTSLIILTSVALAQQTIQQNVSSSGTIKVIGASIFWDTNCTNKVTSITWGTITPGTSIRKNVYVRNDGTATGTLSMSYGNWTPTTAASYLTLTWNCTNCNLARSALVCAELTLAVQSNITGITDFNFIIFIQAAG